MNIIDKVDIFGLWGSTTPILMTFDQKFNFIIGENGTGKTTVINLISAVLLSDFEKLDKIHFSKVSITLREVGGRKRPVVEVIKTPREDMPYCDVAYKIKQSSRDQGSFFDMDAFAEEVSYRGMPNRMLRERMHRQKFVDIQRQMQNMIDVCWLSIHRNSLDDRPSEERRPQLSGVDQKLTSLNNSLVRYFSQQARSYADQTLEFQKKSFLSLLTSEKETDVIDFSTRIDLDSEKKSLATIFEVLGLEPKRYGNPLTTHFRKVADARSSYSSNNAVTVIQFAAMYNAWKTHALVQLYEELQKSKSDIFSSRDSFVDVLNALFGGRKVASISTRNELVIKTGGGAPVPLDELSSGEKQLIIILGEALLQEGRPVVYIADEPELSLHVKWQELLTTSIVKLNPNAQIVFATHSPDIVSVHGDKIIDMEKWCQ